MMVGFWVYFKGASFRYNVKWMRKKKKITDDSLRVLKFLDGIAICQVANDNRKHVLGNKE